MTAHAQRQSRYSQVARDEGRDDGSKTLDSADAQSPAATANESAGATAGIQGEIADRSLELPTATSTRYPDHLMPFVGSRTERNERFTDAVEGFLVNYGYNTARAYRADLEDIYCWADERGLDFFALTDVAFKRYVALMRRRGYSEATIRRRCTAWRGLCAAWFQGP